MWRASAMATRSRGPTSGSPATPRCSSRSRRVRRLVTVDGRDRLEVARVPDPLGAVPLPRAPHPVVARHRSVVLDDQRRAGPVVVVVHADVRPVVAAIVVPVAVVAAIPAVTHVEHAVV